MGLTRRIIFPALRILIWAVIAVALIIIAFRPGGGEKTGAEPLEPGANFTDSLVSPMIGDVENRVSLPGKIMPEAAREITAPVSGTIYRVWVADGEEVETGAPLVVINELLGDGTDEDLFATTTVRAGAAGTARIEVDHGSAVEAGDVVAIISSGTFIVEVEIEPQQMYQLVDAPGTATVKIPSGPPEFTCTSFTTQVVEDEEEGARSQARCFVPADVIVFPGLAVTVEVTTDSASEVLLLPITAVEGTVGAGKVWQRDESGELAAIEVILGLTDGEHIEIISGLSETEEVLEFVPSLQEGLPDWEGEGEWSEEEWVEDEWAEE